MNTQGELARRINLPLLVLYGLGTILGAGIYVLIGKVAASAGLLAPLSFVLAAIIAWLTAMSYSKLAVLFPKSAGEAVYVENSFHQHWLTLSVGLLIIMTGIVSAATLANGFTGYFVRIIPANETVVIITVVVLLTALALWGIAESLIVSAMVTVIEVIGLLIVLFFCGDSLSALPENFTDIFIPQSAGQMMGILSGTFLAFYAFIGFEDMVNVVEEVKAPEHTMPKAIFWVVILSTTLYILIALVGILSLPLEALAQSKAPLAEILTQQNPSAAKAVSLISVLAIVNGILIQMIMASRVSYGMSKNYGGPTWLHWVSPLTKTPIYATLIISGLILLLALFFPLVTLAKFTSFIVLIVFSLVNLALWKIKHDNYKQAPSENVAHINGMRSYPEIAGLLCLGLLLFQIYSLF